MICPIDAVQMHQYKKLGGGKALDDSYTTWEVKECPTCGRLILESYSATVLTQEELNKLMQERQNGE